MKSNGSEKKKKNEMKSNGSKYGSEKKKKMNGNMDWKDMEIINELKDDMGVKKMIRK
jgi:hypothetical protein